MTTPKYPLEKKLTCARCGHVWIYRGANAFYCSCPHCKTTVPLRPPVIRPNREPRPIPKIFTHTCRHCSHPHPSKKDFLKMFRCSKCLRFTIINAPKPTIEYTCKHCNNVYTSRKQRLKKLNCQKCHRQTIFKYTPVIELPMTHPQPYKNVTVIELPYKEISVKSDKDLPIIKNEPFAICHNCKISFPGCMRKCKLLREVKHE